MKEMDGRIHTVKRLAEQLGIVMIVVSQQE
jgi:hypothetical protein